MSFITYTMACKKCEKDWNSAFGIVGSTVIADGGPTKCPHCNSSEIFKKSDGWNASNNK